MHARVANPGHAFSARKHLNGQVGMVLVSLARSCLGGGVRRMGRRVYEQRGGGYDVVPDGGEDAEYQRASAKRRRTARLTLPDEWETKCKER